MRGVVVAGTHSGCGKTTVTLGLLAALRKKGLVVQPFKAGPDYIDAGLHRVITGRPSRNLDLWMCGESYVRECLRAHSSDADFAVVEGVMGLFDGELSTAALAKALGLPVVLVIDGYGMAETSGAFVRGFKDHAEERGVRLAGVIFNRVASPSHYRRLAAGAGEVPLRGYLPRDLGFEIPHRHLGLAVAEEDPLPAEQIDILAERVSEFIDCDALIRAGESKDGADGEAAWSPPRQRSRSCVVAVAYDRAFNFYYEDNLDLLRREGAEIVRFSPLTDEALPSGAGFLYFGGGYPEIYGSGLSKNAAMRMAVREWASKGRPIYAECGGLMYLSKGIRDFTGAFFEMAGVLPFSTRMTQGRSRLGYRKVYFAEDCIIGVKGGTARGHEFHYSEIESRGEEVSLEKVYRVENGSGGREALPGEGYRWRNTLASYIHIHFGSNPAIAENLVSWGKERGL